jgi:hypothetical protein
MSPVLVVCQLLGARFAVARAIARRTQPGRAVAVAVSFRSIDVISPGSVGVGVGVATVTFICSRFLGSANIANFTAAVAAAATAATAAAATAAAAAVAAFAAFAAACD